MILNQSNRYIFEVPLPLVTYVFSTVRPADSVGSFINPVSSLRVFGFVTKQTITYRSRYANDPLLLKCIIIVLWWLYSPIETLHGELIRSFSGLFRALCALHVAINFWNINSLTMSMFDLAAFIDWKNILTNPALVRSALFRLNCSLKSESGIRYSDRMSVTLEDFSIH
ncbi:hypothetical protein NLI96_g10015 [Meripilus lineatus]|uniref:Uncharacterized protein n=1 Tax=Meripilus lineatus TaxID=2056292 RepID=A0AAD5YEP5_9APHY|nr:hypothetical protein NLI96_g10015 [Physisporinus lineatus]